MSGDCTQTSDERNLDTTISNDFRHTCVTKICLLQLITACSTAILECAEYNVNSFSYRRQHNLLKVAKFTEECSRTDNSEANSQTPNHTA